jgi:hypothetical protein
MDCIPFYFLESVRFRPVSVTTHTSAGTNLSSKGKQPKSETTPKLRSPNKALPKANVTGFFCHSKAKNSINFLFGNQPNTTLVYYFNIYLKSQCVYISARTIYIDIKPDLNQTPFAELRVSEPHRRYRPLVCVRKKKKKKRARATHCVDSALTRPDLELRLGSRSRSGEIKGKFHLNSVGSSVIRRRLAGFERFYCGYEG